MGRAKFAPVQRAYRSRWLSTMFQALDACSESGDGASSSRRTGWVSAASLSLRLQIRLSLAIRCGSAAAGEGCCGGTPLGVDTPAKQTPPPPPICPARSAAQVKFFANGTAPTPAPVAQTPSPPILSTAPPARASTPSPTPAPVVDPSAGVQGTESPASPTSSPTAAETPAPGDESYEYNYTGREQGEDLGVVAITFGGGFALLSLIAVGSIFLSRKTLNPASTHPLEDSIKGDAT